MKIRNLLLLIFVIFIPFLFIFTINSNAPTNNKSVTSISPANQIIVRQPAVAGSFYPSSVSNLDKQLENYLNKATLVQTFGKLRILIVPHAGIDYSGQTAAFGFKQLQGQNYKHIIILGPSHNDVFNYAAVFGEGQWQTPLGKVSVDEALANSIIDDSKQIINDPKMHEKEHSLEMEVIFLQKVLKNFRIVPILVSNPSDSLIDNLAAKISENYDDSTLLVISSDLSHYPSFSEAEEVDQQTIAGILTGQKSSFEEAIKSIESKNYPNLETPACGYQAIRVGLKVAQNLKLQDFKKIFSQNSGDVIQDKTRVVGYGAIGVWGEKLPQTSTVNQLNEQTQKEATQIARETLTNYLENKNITVATPQNKILEIPLGAFVTLYNKKDLRGCVGEFEPKDSLAKVIADMTIAAASKDIRFAPVRLDELNDIKIEISVMTPKRKINNWQEIVLGKQGVVVQNGLRSGTFLPQVAKEFGWTKEQFLSQLCTQKAGLPENCYKDPSTTIYVFEAQVFSENE